MLFNFEDKNLAEKELFKKYSEVYNVELIDRNSFIEHISRLKESREHAMMLKDYAKGLLESANQASEDDTEPIDDEVDSNLREFAFIEPTHKKSRKEENVPTLLKDLVEEMRGTAITAKKQLAPQLKVRADVPEEYKAICIERYIALRTATDSNTAAATWRLDLADFLTVHGLLPKSPAFRHEVFQIREEVASWLTFGPDDAVLLKKKEAWFLPFSQISRMLFCFCRMMGKNVETLEKKFKLGWSTGFVDMVELVQLITSSQYSDKLSYPKNERSYKHRFSRPALGHGAAPRATEPPGGPQPNQPPRTCRFCGVQVSGLFKFHRCT